MHCTTQISNMVTVLSILLLPAGRCAWTTVAGRARDKLLPQLCAHRRAVGGFGEDELRRRVRRQVQEDGHRLPELDVAGVGCAGHDLRRTERRVLPIGQGGRPHLRPEPVCEHDRQRLPLPRPWPGPETTATAADGLPTIGREE